MEFLVLLEFINDTNKSIRKIIFKGTTDEILIFLCNRKSNLDESDVEGPPIARQPPQVFALISGKEAILFNHMVLKIY